MGDRAAALDRRAWIGEGDLGFVLEKRGVGELFCEQPEGAIPTIGARGARPADSEVVVENMPLFELNKVPM